MNDRVRFKKPPVVEVACGITFAAVSLRAAHIGLFWQRVRKDFPQLEETIPLSRTGEVANDRIEVTFGELPIPRTWMICEDGSALIQLQRDRLIYNWKAGGDKPYPSYDAVIDEFERHLETFSAFLKEEHLGVVNAAELDLTYVNHIPFAQMAEDEALLVDHVRREPAAGRFLPKPAEFFWSSVYPLPDEGGALRVTAQKARSVSGGEEIIRLDMSARGSPSKNMSQRDWFDLAHTWITRGFADLTGPKTQNEVWERTS